MRPRLLVVAAGLAVLLVGLVVILLQSAPRRSGTDRTSNERFVNAISGGQSACQSDELLPADTGALQFTLGTYGLPGPPFGVRVTSASGRQLTSGSLVAGWRQGVLRIPVQRVASASEDVQVCLRNEAPVGRTPVALAGVVGIPGYQMTIAGRTVPMMRIRIDYLRPGRETWLALLPAIAHRTTLGRSDLVRHWGWLAAPLLMLVAIALAIRIVLAEPEPTR